jgi:hypothetical protein
MPVAATCLIMCPNCKALFRTQRRQCCQCGEELVQSEAVLAPPIGRSWGEENKNMQEEIRKFRRVPVEIEANTVSGEGCVGEPISIEDLCKGGLQFRASRSYREGMQVHLLVPIDGKQVVATGIVRRTSRALGTGRTFICGIEFLHTDPGLEEYISKLG